MQKCDYCDFFSLPLGSDAFDQNRIARVPRALAEPWLKALEQELDQRLDTQFSGRTVNTIYLGGGTASLLRPRVLASVLELIQSRLSLDEDCEITLEANPENTSPQQLQAWFAAGFNRLHVGYQTRDARRLTDLNRYFDAESYRSLPERLAQSPFDNWGLDLIYGFGSQTALEFYADLKAVLEFQPQHLSLYSLTVEPGTALARKLGSRQPGAAVAMQTLAPDEDLQSRIFGELPERLAAEGYEQYEVSNYARPGYASRHNLRYWLWESWIGLGPGAHGFTGQKRYQNTRLLDRWLAAPAGAALQAGDVRLEFPIGYLRLCGDLSPAFYESIILESLAAESVEPPGQAWPGIDALFREWQAAGYLKPGSEPATWRWTANGLAWLDDRILEASRI
ncbi:MAG: coproporphyrinogen III oxidase family protein [Leptospiraceae bacterium]|nr:coproporphyrinogen III oxidase family protein [Leptospiraceae bacterium]